MSYEEVFDMAAETGLPFAYDHFAEGESPAPPFLVFRFPTENHFAADGKAYFKTKQLDFELYTAEKSPETEQLVNAVLDSHGLFYTWSEVWIPTENLYEVLYQMEV